MYAHETIFSTSDVCSGWCATGLYTLYHGVVLGKVGHARKPFREATLLHLETWIPIPRCLTVPRQMVLNQY
jgi:hypothetical protein